MIPSPLANERQQDRAARVIQNAFRKHQKKCPMETGAERLTRLSEAAQKQIALTGLVQPRFTKPVFKLLNEIIVRPTFGATPLFLVFNDQKVEYANIGGHYLLRQKPLETNCTPFQKQFAIRTLLGKLGVGTFLPSIKSVKINTQLEQWFSSTAGPKHFDTYTCLTGKILASKSFVDAVKAIQNLSQKEKLSLEKIVSEALIVPNAQESLNPLFLLKAILHNAQDNTLPQAVNFDILLQTLPRVKPFPISTLPQEQQKLLEELNSGYSKSSEMTRNLVDLSGLTRASKKLFDSRISDHSFETLLISLLLLGTHEVEALQFSYSATSKGAVNLHLFYSNFEIEETNPFSYPGFCWLMCCEKINQKISSNLQETIQRWDIDSVKHSLESFSEQEKNIFLERLYIIKKLVESRADVTNMSIVLALRPDWTFTHPALNWAGKHFSFLPQSIFRAGDFPKNHQEVHLLKRTANRIQWIALKKYKKEIERLVNKLMPSVIRVVRDMIEKGDQQHRKPYYCEDNNNPKKFIGYNCCGPTSSVLTFFLRLCGVPAELTGSSRKDHAFIRIPTSYGAPLYIDPTYKQLFYRSERTLELFWYQLPPALVGTTKDFKDFYLNVQGRIKPFESYWIHNPESKKKMIGLMDTLYVFKPEYRSHLGAGTRAAVERIIEESDHIPRTASIEMLLASQHEQDKKAPSASIQELEEIVKTRIEPLYSMYLKSALPNSTWCQLYANPTIELDINSLNLCMRVCGVLLQESGFRVRWLTSSSSPFSYYLQVEGKNGPKKIVVPAFHHILRVIGPGCIDEAKLAAKIKSEPKTFVGDKSSFEKNVNEVLTEQAKQQFYPNGFICVEGCPSGDIEIANLEIEMKDPLDMADASLMDRSFFVGMLLSHISNDLLTPKTAAA
jgi:hypothetical protein